MKIYVDLQTMNIVTDPRKKKTEKMIELKRGDTATLDLAFIDTSLVRSASSASDAEYTLGWPAGTGIKFCAKAKGDYDGSALVYCDTFTSTGPETGASVSATGPGGISSVTVRNGGAGYSSPPQVSFVARDGSGAGAEGTAQLSKGAIASYVVVNGGDGYMAKPSLSISSTTGSGAVIEPLIEGGRIIGWNVVSEGSDYQQDATATVIGGAGSGATVSLSIAPPEIVGARAVTPGSGYQEGPAVTISGGGGSSAEAVAVVRDNGRVDSIVVTNAGASYTSAPTVEVAAGSETTCTATAVLSPLKIDNISITTPGRGYPVSAAPKVEFTNCPGTSALAVLNDAGEVSAVNILTQGAPIGAPSVKFVGGSGSGAAGQIAFSGTGVSKVNVTSSSVGFSPAPRLFICPSILTMTANPNDGDVVTIGTFGYRFKNTLISANDVKIGATASLSVANLVAAINSTGSPGTDYHTGTARHPLVEAAQGAGDTMGLTAPQIQFADIQTLESTATTRMEWNKPYLRGSGVSADIMINSLGQATSIHMKHAVSLSGIPYAADYEEAPTVIVSGGGGITAVPVMQDRMANSFSITSGGSGYSKVKVEFIGTTGSGASASIFKKYSGFSPIGIMIDSGGSSYSADTRALLKYIDAKGSLVTVGPFPVTLVNGSVFSVDTPDLGTGAGAAGTALADAFLNSRCFVKDASGNVIHTLSTNIVGGEITAVSTNGYWSPYVSKYIISNVPIQWRDSYTIYAPSTGGTDAVITANQSARTVKSINITAAGSSTPSPSVSFVGGGGSGAQGMVVVGRGIASVSVKALGSNYAPASDPRNQPIPGENSQAEVTTKQEYTYIPGAWSSSEADVMRYEIASGKKAHYVSSQYIETLGGYSSKWYLPSYMRSDTITLVSQSPAPSTNPLYAPSVVVTGGGGRGAVIKPVILNGRVVSYEVLSPGYGYTSPPSISVVQVTGDQYGGEVSRNASASGTAFLEVGDSVGAVLITEPGEGYTSPPTVVFTNPSTAEVITTVSAVAELEDPVISGVMITNPGRGYFSPKAFISGGGSNSSFTIGLAVVPDTNDPSYGAISGLDFDSESPDATWRSVEFTSSPTIRVTAPDLGAPVWEQATAELTMRPRTVARVAVTNPGSGYPPSPSVSFSGSGGSGASGRALVSQDGKITGVILTSGGVGYPEETTASIVQDGILWTSGATYSTGSKVYYSGRRYEVTVGGTSGTLAPTHTVGGVAATGGSATLDFHGLLASLVVDVNTGAIRTVTVTDAGSDYSTSLPTVEIHGGNGSGARAVADVRDGKITGVRPLNGGSGYESVPQVSIVSPTGGGAVVRPIMGPVGVVSVEVTNPGYGYLTPPDVVFSGGGGFGALASCELSPTGKITGYVVTDPGSGYDKAPEVNVASSSDYSAPTFDLNNKRPKARAVVAFGKVIGIIPVSTGDEYASSPQVLVEPPPPGYHGSVNTNGGALATLLGSGVAADVPYVDLDAEVEIRAPGAALEATYVVADNVVTVTTTDPHQLEDNDPVRIDVGTGAMADQTNVEIEKTGASTFTFPLTTTNTTGTCSVIPIRIFSTKTVTLRVHNDVNKGDETYPE
jgi:hypothetical protein